MTAVLDLTDPTSWPNNLHRCLETLQDVFLGWEKRAGAVKAADYDRAEAKLHEALQPYSILGWHCTRLTAPERDRIIREGMGLPNGDMLMQRVLAARADGLLRPDVAERLMAEHQADHTNRVNRIWFCFFPPRIAGESGIGRFFRYWGGEALYGMHELDPVTGPSLRVIGRPCLVEAEVPVASLGRYTYLTTKVARRYLDCQGFETQECMDHEDCALQPVPAAAVRRVLTFDDPDFAALTGCEAWGERLDGGVAVVQGAACAAT